MCVFGGWEKAGVLGETHQTWEEHANTQKSAMCHVTLTPPPTSCLCLISPPLSEHTCP